MQQRPDSRQGWYDRRRAGADRLRRNNRPISSGLLGLIYINIYRSAVDATNANRYHLRMISEPNTRLVAQARADGAVTTARQARISSRALLGPGGELIIEHGGREYRLRLTQNGKLILTA